MALIGGIYVRTFLVQAFRVPSESMQPGLLVGDHILVNKFVYGGSRGGQTLTFPWLPRRDPRRGDVVVLFSSRYEHYLVKRCVGLPGDTLEFSHDHLYINRRKAEEHYVQSSRSAGDALQPTTVPLDRYFYLGDQRSISRDSRIWGALSADHIVGQGFVIYWSEATSDDPEPDRLGTYSRDRLSWHQRFRWKRLMKPIR